MKYARALAAGAAAAMLAGSAQAASVGFVATTTCLTNCAAAGLTAGQEVRARLSVDDAGFTPGGFLQDADLLGFRVSFGGTSLTSENAFGSSFFGQWGSTRRDITDFSVQAALNEAPTPGPAFGISNLLQTSFTLDGFCQNATCGLIEIGNAASGSPATISAVPLPPALLFAASGFAALAFLRLGTRRG